MKGVFLLVLLLAAVVALSGCVGESHSKECQAESDCVYIHGDEGIKGCFNGSSLSYLDPFLQVIPYLNCECVSETCKMDLEEFDISDCEDPSLAQYTRDKCYYEIAKYKKDASACDKIQDEGYKHWCDGEIRDCIEQTGEPALYCYNPAEEFCWRPNIAAVYSCGEYAKTVSSLDGTGATYYKLGEDGRWGNAIKCPIVEPSTVSEECRRLTTNSNCVETWVC